MTVFDVVVNVALAIGALVGAGAGVIGTVVAVLSYRRSMQAEARSMVAKVHAEVAREEAARANRMLATLAMKPPD